MDAPNIEFCHELSLCESDIERFDLVVKKCAELGFEYVGFGARLPINTINPKIVMTNNFPDAWQKKYAESNYLAIDPTVKHALNFINSITWDDELFSDQREFHEEAVSHGLKYGWSLPIYDGRVCALVTFARSNSELTVREVSANYESYVGVSQAIHNFIGSTLINESCPEMAIDLTSREIEVVKWTIEGKTAEEIGIILSISTRTVNFHISNVMKKLNAYNKTSAVIKAVKLKLV